MRDNFIPRRRAFCALASAGVLAGRVRAEAPAMLRFGGTGGAMGGIRLLAPLMAEAGITLHHVRQLGTAGGIRAVRAGAVDVSVSSRPLQPGEAQGGFVATLYARSPLVFATHRATVADSLSLDEAVEKFAGRITHWPGGERVRLSRRPEQDGDTHLLATVSPAMAAALATLQNRPGVVTAGTDHEQAAALESVPGTLGGLAQALILSEQRPLKILPLRDPPATGWPLQKLFFLVTRAEPSPVVQRFVAVLGSEAAARVLSAHGHGLIGGSPA